MPVPGKNVCLVECSPPLVRAFEESGCRVLSLRPGPDRSLLDLPAELETHGFEPDIVFQQENLGRRLFLEGLDALDCPRFFWSVDPHLNAYWHSCYAKLFDLTLCTQKRWRAAVEAFGVRTAHLPWYGHARPWHPFGDRSHDMAFAGRVTAQRPMRRRLVEILAERYAERFVHRDDLTLPQMLDFYADSRLAPNESILGEVNFRLFETASCGCVPVTQDLGSEQDALFEPGIEAAVYADAAEMRALCDHLLSDRAASQAMARAAWERVNRDHLPEHRVARILELAEEAVSTASNNQEKWLTLAATRLLESGPSVMDNGELVRRLRQLPADAEVTAAMLRMQALADDKAAMASSAATVFANTEFATNTDLNLCAATAAMRCGGDTMRELARAILMRHLRAIGARIPDAPESSGAMLRQWARLLLRQGKIIRHGFPFSAVRHLPGAATDCLVTSLELEPENLESLRLMENATRGQRGLEHARSGYLAMLTLHVRGDWRLELESALADLRSFRIKQGMETLRYAQGLAIKAEAERAFHRALRANDPRSFLSGLLGRPA